MKKIILLLIVAFLSLGTTNVNAQDYSSFHECLYNQNESILNGFNVVVAPFQKMLENIPQELVDDMKTIKPSNKYMRFESGEGLSDQPFDDQLTKSWIYFYKLVGVTHISLRAKRIDIEGSVRTANMFEDAGLTVYIVEGDNEPFLKNKNPAVSAADKQALAWGWLFGFLKKAMYERQAVRYADEFKPLADAFIDEFGERYRDKLAYASLEPSNSKKRAWYYTLEKELKDYNNIIIHIYTTYPSLGKEERFNKKLEEGLKIIQESGKNWYVTEFNGYNFQSFTDKELRDIGLSEQHINQSCKVYNLLIKYGAKAVFHHYLLGFSENGESHPFLYYSIDRKTNKVTKNYK